MSSMTMSPAKVLVADDEPDLVSILTEWLEDDGYEVVSANDGAGAIKLFFQHKPILSITDLRMPGLDGFQFITRIREMSDAHVLVLTALGGEDHVVRGLDLGADEYLVKPVTKRAFLARVRSLLRRATSSDEPSSGYSDSALTLNFLTHEVQIRGKTLHLRPTEFRLLAFLAQNSDRVIGHHELLDKVWGDQSGSLGSLKWYISSLRDKLEENSQKPTLIVTVSRVGYRYVPPGPSHPEMEQQAAAL